MDIERDDLAIAKLVWTGIGQSPWFKALPPAVKELYHRYPPWAFYVKTESSMHAVRVLGVFKNSRGEWRLLLATALMGSFNVAPDGFLPHEVRRVDDYPQEAKDWLVFNKDPEVFLRHCAVYNVIMEAQDVLGLV